MTDDGSKELDQFLEQADADDLPDDLDPDELRNQSDPGPDRSLTFRVSAFLVENILLVVSTVVLGTLILLSVLQSPVPRWLRFVAIPGVFSMLLLGRPVAKRVKAMLWNPSSVWIVSTELPERGGGIYRMPSQRWRQWDVVDGEVDWVSPSLAFAQAVDLETQTCEGTWIGTLSDRELMRGLQEVYKCREMLEEDAKRGFAVDSQAWVIIRNATRAAVMRVVSTFESETLPDEGESVDDEINKALDQFDLERNAANEDRSPDAAEPGTNGHAEDTKLEDVDLSDPNLKQIDRAAEIARGDTDGR